MIHFQNLFEEKLRVDMEYTFFMNITGSQTCELCLVFHYNIVHFITR